MSVEPGHAALPELPPAPPRLIRFRGNLIAVGFDLGAPFAVIKRERCAVRCRATEELVDLALSLRGGEVEATVLESPEPRLLALSSAERSVEPPSLERALVRMDARWGRTLVRLAQ